jgi:hypothetical protein
MKVGGAVRLCERRYLHVISTLHGADVDRLCGRFGSLNLDCRPPRV